MAPQDTQADDYSEESLLTLIQALAINQQELASQVGQLQASVTSTTNNTTNTTNNSYGVVSLDSPYLAVSGTTTAYSSMQTTSVSSAVPSGAKTLFLTCECKFDSVGRTPGAQSMVWTVYTPGGSTLPLFTSYPSQDDTWGSNSIAVACSNQNLLWSIVNSTGGTVTTGWVSYKVWVTGYAL